MGIKTALLDKVGEYLDGLEILIECQLTEFHTTCKIMEATTNKDRPRLCWIDNIN
jgi:hypothetical protein